MTKCDPKFSSQGIQTDSCLSDTLFASKSDLDNLKAELLYKMTEIRSEMNALNSVSSLSKSGPLSLNHPQVVQLSSIHHPPADSLPYTQSSPRNLSNNNKNLNPTFGENSDTASDTPADGHNIQNRHFNEHKIVIAGDSLLHRMSSKRMNVKDIPTVKLTKPGDNLAGTASRCINYISKHNNDQIDVVLMAGTNDLSNHKVSPEDLIKSTDEYITQIKGFSNVGKIFICKIPPRCNFHAVNLKVSEYNSLLVERFDNTEEFLEVIDTIKPEIRYFHHDGLYMSNVGLKRLCGIILSKLYKVLLPSHHSSNVQHDRSRPRHKSSVKSSSNRERSSSK